MCKLKVKIVLQSEHEKCNCVQRTGFVYIKTRVSKDKCCFIEITEVMQRQQDIRREYRNHVEIVGELRFHNEFL